MKHIPITTLVFALLMVLPSCYGIYEDEIGLADWYQPHIGRINTAVFVPPRQVVVVTDSAVLAGLNLKTGELLWRQVLPQGTTIDKLHYFDQSILVVSGRRVSVWSAADEGSLRWEEEEESDIIEAKISEGIVSIATTTGITLRSVSTGATAHTSTVVPLPQTSLHILSNSLYAVQAADSSLHVSSIGLQSPYTHSSSAITLSSAATNGKPVITADGHVVVLGGASGKFSVFVHQLKATSRTALVFPLDAQITQATLQVLGNDSFVVTTATEQLVFRPKKSDSDFPFSIVEKLSLTSKAAAAGSQLVYTNGATSTVHYTNRTGSYQSTVSSLPNTIFLLPPSPFVLLVGEDWSATTYSLNALLAPSTPSPTPLAPLWKREEALAAVVRTEIIELPLDVTDLTDLVREFEGDEKSNTFISRALGQIEHLKHLALNIGTILSGIVEDAAAVAVGRKELSEKELITKDRFGFRKLIVAVTASGKIFGLSTDHGQIVWGNHVRTTGFSKNAFVYLTRSSAAYPPEIVVGDSNLFHKLQPITGELISSTPTPSLLQVIPLPFLYTHTGSASHLVNTHIIMLVHAPASSSQASLTVSLFPETKETKEIFLKGSDKVHFFLVNKASATVTGYSFPERNSLVASVSWNVTFNQEEIAGLSALHPHDKVYHPAAVLGDRRIATVSTVAGTSVLHIYVLDTVTGAIVFHTQHADCGALRGKVALVLMENSLVYTYWNTKTHKHQMSVIDMYTKTVDWSLTHFSSYTSQPPITLQQSYVLPTPVSLLAHTSSARGITAKHLLLGLASDSVVSLDKRWADARRPHPSAITPADREENLIPYIPRLYFPPQTFVTYNKTVNRLSAIVTTGATLESTTLVLAVGLDLFFTRISPAEAYDILTSDFNYPMLILTITVLCIATVVTSRLSARKDLVKSWK